MPEQGTGGTGGARCTMVQPPARTSGTGTGAPRLPARWYTVRTRTVCAVEPDSERTQEEREWARAAATWYAADKERIVAAARRLRV